MIGFWSTSDDYKQSLAAISLADGVGGTGRDALGLLDDDQG